MSEKPSKPRAFRLDDPNVMLAEAGDPSAAPARGRVLVTAEADDVAKNAPFATAPAPRSRWAALFWSAAGGLVSLAVGLAVLNLIEDLFARADWLGWLAAALALMAALALLAVALREGVALARLARIEHLHDRAASVLAKDDREGGRRLARELVALYRDAPRMARARAAVEAAAADIVDGAELLRIAERELFSPIDEEARRLVADAAKRVSLVTAVSPRALVDILFVAAETVRLLRRLARLYGGRPGSLALMRLFRHALGNLAVTGGMAAGDSLLSQALGHGLASRISAKLGEGVLNGILIARLGVAAIAAIRPLPFIALPRPGVADLVSGLMTPQTRDE